MPEETPEVKELTTEEKLAAAETLEAEVDQEFVKEYNDLVKKFKRTIVSTLQIQRVK